jgi:methionyl-tRNA formyltransferase
MRVALFGSGSFALPVLQAIQESKHELIAVVTQPPRPAGRGGKLRPTLIAEHCRRTGIEPLECPDVNDPAVVSDMAALAADVHCVVEFGQKVLAPMRKTARLEAFNLHASLLPRLRGAAPINWALIRGRDATGVTTFRLVDRMDAGPIYLKRSTPIEPTETAGELKQRLASLGTELVMETLGQLAAGWIEPTEQDESAATRAPRLSKADGRLDFTEPARALRCRIHGTYPWPGAQAIYAPREGKECRVVIARAREIEAQASGPPGEVADDLTVNAGSGRLEIIEIKPAGKRCMGWKDFVNGHRVAAGDRFTGVAGGRS